jgi:hypothetical protein
VIRKNQVYRKSAKGAEAIATRQHGLGPKQRSMLILVDGKRKAEELTRMSQALGDAEPTLQFLLEQGFIEETVPAPSVAEAPVAAQQPAGAVQRGPGVPLLEAQRFASRRLLEVLGPTAETLCIRIEATRNVQDFEAVMAGAQNLVRDIRGPGMAERFAADIAGHWPAG